MKPFYNTSQPFSLNPPTKPIRTPAESVQDLEDRISDYREYCNKGYCKFDERAMEELKKELASEKCLAKQQ